MDISNNINSAIVSGLSGFKKASEGVTQNAANLSSLSIRNQTNNQPSDVLANATTTQLGAIKQSIPQAEQGITSDLLGLSINLNNAQASTKVIGTARDTVGTILDILA
ncbi:hypothetical protein [Paraglaciecola aestuariivivens]